MKKHILLMIVVALSTHVMAENMPSICKDLVDVDLRKKILEPNDKIKSGLYDINNDGIEEKVVIGSLGREQNPVGLYLHNKETNDYISYEPYEHVRFDESLEVFHYHDKYYIQHYYTRVKKIPTYITYINSKNKEIPICKFKSVQKLIPKEHNTTFDCNALHKRYKEGKSVIFDIPSKFKFDVTREYGLNTKRTTIGNIAYFDYNNDGVKEYVQEFEDKYTMQHSYRLIEDNMKTLIDNDTVSREYNRAWLRYQDKVYFVNGFLDSVSRPISIGIIDKNTSKEVCFYDYLVKFTLDENITKQLKKYK